MGGMVDFAKEFDARRTGAEDGEFVQELSGLVKVRGAREAHEAVMRVHLHNGR